MMRVLKSALLPAALFLAFCCGAEPAPLKVSDGKLTAGGQGNPPARHQLGLVASGGDCLYRGAYEETGGMGSERRPARHDPILTSRIKTVPGTRNVSPKSMKSCGGRSGTNST